MGKNTRESLGEAYGKDLGDNKSDLYAELNEENAHKSALKEEQEKALKDFELQKDKESGNLYDDVNKKHELEAEQEEAKKAYEAQFEEPKKGSAADKEKKDWEKLRQKDDIEKEKRAAEFKKEEEKRQEKKDFVKSYKRQLGEAEDNIDNASIDSKKTVVNKIGATVDNAPIGNAPVDNETDLQKIIRERNKNMPDKIGDDLLDNDLKERAAEILATGEKDAETQRKIINKQDKRIDGLSIENEQLEKFFEKANNRLDAMKDELDRQIEEVKNPTIKETIIKFLKKPKVKGAIVFGLAGAAVYAASGGTAVPVYFAVKAALAKAGISIFVPAAAGYGLSTWGTAAAAGGAAGEFASYLAKKLGLSKGEKSDKEKHQEGLENLKNIANGQQTNEARQKGQNQGGEVSGGNNAEKSTESNKEVFDVAGIVEFVKEAKKNNLTAQDLLNEFDGKIERIEEIRQLIVPEMKIFALFQKDKDINAAHKWLREKLEEIKDQKLTYQKNAGQQPPETAAGPKESAEKKTDSEVMLSEVNEMENLIIGFKNGKTSGKEILEYIQPIEELHKKYGDDDKVRPLISAIQGKTYSFDKKTRGQIADAMIKYAQKQKIKPDEVKDYVTYFQNIGDLNSENYKWLTGKEKEEMAGEKEEEKNKSVLGIEIKGLDEVKKMTREEVEGQMRQVHGALNKLAEGLNEKGFEKLRETDENYKKLHSYQQNVLGRQWLETRNEAEKKKPTKQESSSEKEVKSPVIKIELNAETTIKMQKKLQELKQELQEKRENIDPYKAPERVNEIIENLRYKITIIEKLLSTGIVSTHELSREILKKDNRIQGDAFNEACGEMNNFVKNIENGKKVTGGKEERITKIEKTRDPFVEASEKNLEDFIKNSSELQSIIKMVEDPKVSINDLGKKIEAWNFKYPGILTGLYVQKEYIGKGKEKAIKITMDDKGNVWVAGGDPDGLKYLKY